VEISDVRGGDKVVAPDKGFRFPVHRDGPELFQFDRGIDAVVGVKFNVGRLDGSSAGGLVDGPGAHGGRTLDVENIAVNIGGRGLGGGRAGQGLDGRLVEQPLVL